MAGLVVVAGLALIDKHRARKEARAQKLMYDDERYAELQRETTQRLAQSPVSADGADYHRRIVSDTSTVDTMYNDKYAAAATDDAPMHRKSKWWKVKRLRRRSQS